MGIIPPVITAAVAFYSIVFAPDKKCVILTIIWYVVSAILVVVLSKRVGKEILAS